MPLIQFDPPDRFVAGTVGPPGQRTFFLQASSGSRITSVSLEKQQVSLLADRVNDLLDDFAGGAAVDPPAGEEDTAPLDTPIEDEFRVGTMSLGWDADRGVVILECHDLESAEAAAAAAAEAAEEADENEGDDEGDDGGAGDAEGNEVERAVTAAQQALLADAEGERHSVFRVVIDPPAARAFARRCAKLVAAGRPPCPFCGGPLDATGHICPRANGYKR